MISDERLSKALTFLSETDMEAAERKADVERQMFRFKKVKAAIFEHGEGAMDLRKAIAENSPEAEAAYMDYLKELADFETLANKRKTETLIVDVWRSLNASRRQGIIQ